MINTVNSRDLKRGILLVGKIIFPLLKGIHTTVEKRVSQKVKLANCGLHVKSKHIHVRLMLLFWEEAETGQ